MCYEDGQTFLKANSKESKYSSDCYKHDLHYTFRDHAKSQNTTDRVLT